MQRVASRIAVGENKWLCALTLSPAGGEFRRVPVDFVEEVRSMDPARWAVAVGGKLHIGLIGIEPGSRVVAGREMDISSEWRGISIAVLIWETNTSTQVLRILNTNTMQTVRVDRVQWLRSAGSWADPLDWLRCAVREIKNGCSPSSRWGAEVDVTNQHSVTRLESFNLIRGSLEAV